MARSARPTNSAFSNLLRTRRDELGLSRFDLASRLGWSQSFADALETGRRGCDLNDLPRLAAALSLDPGAVAQVYLLDRHPGLYRALFGEARPEVKRMPEVAVVEDVHWRLERLPRRERGIAEALIYAFDDLCHSRRHTT